MDGYIIEKKCKPIETEVSGPTRDPEDFEPEEGMTYNEKKIKKKGNRNKDKAKVKD